MIKIPKLSDSAKMPAGGYICRIVNATETTNRYGEPCLVLSLDVDEGEFKNYFGKIYARRLERSGIGRYPCVYCQTVGKYSTRNFKRLIEKIEWSNVGYFFSGKQGEDWDERELEGLKIGVVFAEKEILTARGKKRIHLVPKKLTTIEEILRGDFEVPKGGGSNE